MKSKYLNKWSLTIAAFCIVASLGSCKKFLDQQPITEVGPETVFTDVNSAFQALAGVYGRLTGDQGYGIRLSLYYPVDNDLMMGPTGTQDDRRALAHYTLSSLNSELPGPFNQLFQGISFANIVIDRVPKMAMYSGGSDQQKKQLQRIYGEALTLRAQFYYEAIRNWGDLPEHFLPSYVEAVENPLPVRKDRDGLYERIIEDLKTAAELVPWRNELSSIGDAPDERITKGTVKGLRARIALARGGFSLRQNGSMQRGSDHLKYYQIAKDETNDIINSGQHSLNPSFKALWKDQVGSRVVADPNGELMFQVSGIGQGGTADTKLGYYNGPRVNNVGNSAINVLPTYLYLFDSTDTRRDVTIAPYSIGPDGVTKVTTSPTVALSNIFDGKYRRDWIKNPTVAPSSQVQYFSLKWQILRYADVLLMYAEAENELNGPTASAYNAINMVRRRGFGRAINTPVVGIDLQGLNKETFFKALVRERALELGGEGVRKYDLIRWNLLATAFSGTKANLVKMADAAGVITYSYMLGSPDYASNIANLPIYMFLKNGTTADDASIWANSYYEPLPASPVTPAGTTRINWIHSSVNTTSNVRLAAGFTSGKSELMPIPQPARDANRNLSQNPGY